jgi:phosphotransferase system IIA component
MGEGYKTHTPVIVTNADDYASITALANGEVKVGDALLSVK